MYYLKLNILSFTEHTQSCTQQIYSVEKWHRTLNNKFHYTKHSHAFPPALLLFKHPWDLGRNFDQLTQTSSLLRVGSVKRKKKLRLVFIYKLNVRRGGPNLRLKLYNYFQVCVKIIQSSSPNQSQRGRGSNLPTPPYL